MQGKEWKGCPAADKEKLLRCIEPGIPQGLAMLVFIGSNEKVCMPPTKDIFQRYLRKFSKAGKLLGAEGLGFLDAPAPTDAPAPAP